MEKLRVWRKAHNLSIAEAGAGVGVSGVQWHRLETGRRNVTPEMAVRIEGMAGIPRNELCDVFFRPAPAPKRKREPQTAVA